MISINRLAMKIVSELMDGREEYRVKVEKLPCGATVIDTGLEAVGGYLAGLKLTEICLGGLARCWLTYQVYGDMELPAIVVATDHPAISLLGSQLAGWMVKVGDFFAPSSGPARALALKPKKVFEKLGYKDEHNEAVIVMETTRKPTDDVAQKVAAECKVEPKNLYMVLTTTASMAGSVQVSGRVVETGLYRLEFLGLDPNKVIYASGSAPIMPPHPDVGVSTAREEDALLYGGTGSYVIDEEESKLREFLMRAPATAWSDYGKTSYEALKAVNFDWSKLDPSFFTIGKLTLTSKKTGKTYVGGKVNPEMLKKSMEL
ncbi:MAG: methenyltetrahydromethanopterin cyclohydrolase [Candidatus Nezhaarchaeota archaeon]|nr:methenyltetrahydromethanopterin cyclohydrolase [Candidatus Nezhaarchaeota archaeon]MCX8141553.1 methenyltetrahydromethanopterin cyclohydrolase [Candidatus Nezhaarchaeota archaeon]MDW8049820.1 methenyltetrahydromethanopterin cyclohydrolase [Nitrososphaerota archaeon]